jgi:hypothetical protein
MNHAETDDVVFFSNWNTALVVQVHRNSEVCQSKEEKRKKKLKNRTRVVARLSRTDFPKLLWLKEFASGVLLRASKKQRETAFCFFLKKNWQGTLLFLLEVRMQNDLLVLEIDCLLFFC